MVPDGATRSSTSYNRRAERLKRLADHKRAFAARLRERAIIEEEIPYIEPKSEEIDD